MFLKKDENDVLNSAMTVSREYAICQSNGAANRLKLLCAKCRAGLHAGPIDKNKSYDSMRTSCMECAFR